MSQTLAVTRLQTLKTDPADTRVVTATEPGETAEGEAVFKLTSFALTANNITYAAYGDVMRYWQFFPTGDTAWGHMPVWGFADVVASAVDGLVPGERFYGYFPPASHVRLRPVRVGERGFTEASPHREGLASAYNSYVRCSADPAYDAGREAYQALLSPLFITSFILADLLADNDFFGAKRVLLSSASSKTAYGTAFCLAKSAGIEVVGLTSEGSRPFVDDTQFYAGSVPYGDIESIATDRPLVYVDFSGDNAVRARMHRHFGAALAYDCFVGSSHNTGPAETEGLPGPRTQFFFAPAQIKKRTAEWGFAELMRRYNAAQARFFDEVAQRRLLAVVTGDGLPAAQVVIKKLVAGRTDARSGNVIRLD